MESGSSFKILSIDGGGIKGLYSSTILEHLERKFECQISDYFDMICGTSTGGLIAMALALKKPATDISSFYIKYGSTIFPRRSSIGRKIRQTLYKGLYSDEPLKKVLTEFYGLNRMGDLKNLVCIPSYSVTDAKTWVFKYDHTILDRDNKAFCVDVGLATTAAPTYFPLCEIDYYDHTQFIDGGIWANNPTLVGVIEALKFFVGKDKSYNNIKVLSISSLSFPSGKPIGWKRKRAFINWKSDLFDAGIIAQNFFTDYFMNTLSSLNSINIDYIRIPSEEIAAEQVPLVQLDCATKESIQLLKGKGNKRGELAKKSNEIEQFFKHKKTFNIN